MASSGTLTAEKLAFRAGVPLRTVRFYLQEKLVDPPLGRGRGAHFTEHHLAQLQQARALHNAGFALDAIRERRGELGLGLRVMASFDPFRQQMASFDAFNQHSGAEPPSNEDPAEDGLNPARCIRIPMMQGVELMVSQNQALPSPRHLVEIALYIRKIFTDR
jgi:hypothetical protein